MKQVTLGAHNYHDTYGQLPAGCIVSNGLGWHVFILPFIEQGNLYDKFDFISAGDHMANGGVGRGQLGLTKIKTYLCPSSQAEKMMLPDPPNNVHSPDLINGQSPYTTHYYVNMARKNENSAAVGRSRPTSIPPMMVAPERDTPGIRASV